MKTARWKTQRRPDSVPAWLTRAGTPHLSRFYCVLTWKADSEHHQSGHSRGQLTAQQEGTRGKLRVKFQFSHSTKPPLCSWLHPSTRWTTARHTRSSCHKHVLSGSLLAVADPTCTGISNLGSGLLLTVGTCRVQVII